MHVWTSMPLDIAIGSYVIKCVPYHQSKSSYAPGQEDGRVEGSDIDNIVVHIEC